MDDKAALIIEEHSSYQTHTLGITFFF